MIDKEHKFTDHEVFRHAYHSRTGTLLTPTYKIIFNICYQTNQCYANIYIELEHFEYTFLLI